MVGPFLEMNKVFLQPGINVKLTDLQFFVVKSLPVQWYPLPESTELHNILSDVHLVRFLQSIQG